MSHRLTRMGGQMASGTEAGMRRGHPQIPQIAQMTPCHSERVRESKGLSELPRMAHIHTADRPPQIDTDRHRWDGNTSDVLFVRQGLGPARWTKRQPCCRSPKSIAPRSARFRLPDTKKR
jgi:hypothetical protein